MAFISLDLRPLYFQVVYLLGAYAKTLQGDLGCNRSVKAYVHFEVRLNLAIFISPHLVGMYFCTLPSFHVVVLQCSICMSLS